MTEWKEYITADTLTLAVAIATLIVAIATLVAAIVALVIAKRSFKVSKSSLDVAERSLKFAKESEWQRIKKEFANDTAKLKSLERVMGCGLADNSAIMQQQMLKAEIEQLKQQLK